MIHRKTLLFVIAAVVGLGVYASGQYAEAADSKKKGKTVVLKVPGLTWAVGWPKKIKAALVKVEGVDSVKLKVVKAKKTLFASLSVSDSFKLDNAVAALKKIGYKKCSVVKKKKKGKKE